jgi:hypothetical protein
VHGLSPFIDKIRIPVTSSDPSRPLFAGIAPLALSGTTWPTSATRR